MATERLEAVELRTGQRIWLDGGTTSIVRVKHDPERSFVLVDTVDERIIICRPDHVVTVEHEGPA